MAQTMIRIGSLLTDTPSVVLAFSTSAASAHYDTIKLNGTAYQVTAGKTLYIVKALYDSAGGTTPRINFGYGDTIVADSASAPTNFVSSGISITLLTNSVIYPVDVLLKVPATKYGCISCNTASGANNNGFFWGFEL